MRVPFSYIPFSPYSTPMGDLEMRWRGSQYATHVSPSLTPPNGRRAPRNGVSHGGRRLGNSIRPSRRERPFGAERGRKGGREEGREREGGRAFSNLAFLAAAAAAPAPRAVSWLSGGHAQSQLQPACSGAHMLSQSVSQSRPAQTYA